MLHRKSDYYSQCPMLKKPCIEKLCAWWTDLSGQHPQSGQPMNESMCAIKASVFIQLDIGRLGMQTVSQLQTARNEAAQRDKLTLPQMLARLPENGSA